MVRAIFGAAVVAAALTTSLSAQTHTGRAEAVDGDTLRIAGESVWLHAIDAPETGQECRDASGRTWPCGAEATAALAALLTRELRCEGRGRDRYGRVVAKCHAGGQDVAERLVRDGMAFAYPRYGLDYVDAEKDALFAGRGVWRGGSERPEVVRAARLSQRAPAAAGPEGCAIKGNISSNGQIYHVPGQEHYEATRIDVSRGERWFCTEAEARAAGWRAARR